MLITIREFERSFYGYQITDCAVRNRGFFHFSARNRAEGEKAGVLSEWKVTKREIGFYKDEPIDERAGWQDFSKFEVTHVGAAKRDGKDEVVLVDSGGQVYSRGAGHDDMETPIAISKDGPRMGGSVRRIRMIDGVLYGCGGFRSVFRRRGVNAWESLYHDLPAQTRRENDDVSLMGDMAFCDIDGFNHEDLYVVAGKGVVWNLQGQHWRRCAFPSNMYMESVCCAGDGHVYIGAQSGTVFRGRGDTWKMIHRGDLTLPFKDMVWHAGRLWCTNDYGLWTLEGDRIERVQGLASEVAVSAGNLSAADGVMLMAGTHGAAFHDGTEWHPIFNYYQMEQQLTGK